MGMAACGESVGGAASIMGSVGRCRRRIRLANSVCFSFTASLEATKAQMRATACFEGSLAAAVYASAFSHPSFSAACRKTGCADEVCCITTGFATVPALRSATATKQRRLVRSRAAYGRAAATCMASCTAPCFGRCGFSSTQTSARAAPARGETRNGVAYISFSSGVEVSPVW